MYREKGWGREHGDNEMSVMVDGDDDGENMTVM
jgi:hypothetical protein